VYTRPPLLLLLPLMATMCHLRRQLRLLLLAPLHHSALLRLLLLRAMLLLLLQVRLPLPVTLYPTAAWL
jgi:hypothetical protein